MLMFWDGGVMACGVDLFFVVVFFVGVDRTEMSGGARICFVGFI